MNSMAAELAPMIRAALEDHPRLRTVRRPVARLNPRWYRVTNKSSDVTLVDIYDEIGWFGVTAADFVKDLRGITTPQIELHINSPGGDVFDAVAIYTSLRQHDAQVHVVIDSLAASAASFIAMAGDRITATANAMLMIHDAMGLVIGNAVDMRAMAELLDKHSDNIASIYAARAGGDVAEWRGRMADEAWYNAEEAKAVGLVDEVEGEGQPVTDAWDLSIFTHPPDRATGQQPAEASPDDAAEPAPDDNPLQPDPSAHPEDAPQEPTATANGDGGRRHDYLGESATWYLPPRKEHI